MASDDSNPEDSDDEDVSGPKEKKKEKVRGTAVLVTPKMINDWSKALQVGTNRELVRCTP